MAKQVQFLRNSKLINSVETAKATLNAFLTDTGVTVSDGSFYLARYGTSDNDAKTVIGIAHVGTTGKSMTFIESNEDISSRVTKLEGKVNGITGTTIPELQQKIQANQNNIETNKNSITSLTTVVTGDRVKNTDKSIGVTSASTGTTIKVNVSTARTSGANALILEDDGLYVAPAPAQTVYQGDGKTISVTGSATKTISSTITLKALTTANGGYLKTYQLQGSDGNPIGDQIDIPKDLVVKSGEVKSVTTADTPYEGAVIGDKYIELIIANKEGSPIYIPVKDLVDVYKGVSGVTVDGSNNISIKIDSSTEPYLKLSANGLKISGLTTALAGKASTATTSAIQSELNATQAGAGLSTGGTYQAQAVGVISGATSLFDADVKLASAIEEIKDTSASYLTNVKINGLTGSVSNHIASVTLGGGAIKLTSYVAGEDDSAIRPDDTVNVAFGKIENRLTKTVTSITGTNGVQVSSDGQSKTVSIKLDSKDTILSVSTSGLRVSENAIWDCGTYTTT